MATLTPAQVAQAWVSGGGGSDSDTIARAVAYAYVESGYNTTAVSSTGCLGLWQICGTAVQGDLSDPSVNARAAVAKWKGCHNSFACDWDPYDFGPANPGWAKGYADGMGAAAGVSAPASGTQAPAGDSGVSGFGATIAASIQSATHGISDTAMGIALAALGVAALLAALWLVIQHTSVGQAISSTARSTVRAGALAVAHV